MTVWVWTLIWRIIQGYQNYQILKRLIPAVINILCKVLKLLYMGFQDGSEGALVSQAQIHKEICHQEYVCPCSWVFQQDMSQSNQVLEYCQTWFREDRQQKVCIWFYGWKRYVIPGHIMPHQLVQCLDRSEKRNEKLTGVVNLALNEVYAPWMQTCAWSHNLTKVTHQFSPYSSFIFIIFCFYKGSMFRISIPNGYQGSLPDHKIFLNPFTF